jgi:hypothetical protein
MEIRSAGAELLLWTDGQKNMAALIVAVLSFANALKNPQDNNKFPPQK